MNGAESLVRTLVAGGVEVCFTNPDTVDELVLAFRAGVAVRGPFLIEVVL